MFEIEDLFDLTLEGAFTTKEEFINFASTASAEDIYPLLQEGAFTSVEEMKDSTNLKKKDDTESAPPTEDATTTLVSEEVEETTPSGSSALSPEQAQQYQWGDEPTDTQIEAPTVGTATSEQDSPEEIVRVPEMVTASMQLKEEDAVKELSKEYMKNGFTFKEAGVLDNIEVEADNGNKLYVTLSPEDASPQEVKREAQRLQSFLEENKLDEEDPDYHKKWQEKYNVYINAARVTPNQTIEIEDQVEDEFDSDGSFWDKAKRYYNTIQRGMDVYKPLPIIGTSLLPTMGAPSKEDAVVKATQQLQAEEPDKNHSKEDIINKAKEIRKQELYKEKEIYNIEEHLDDISSEEKEKLTQYKLGEAIKASKYLELKEIEYNKALSEAQAMDEKIEAERKALKEMDASALPKEEVNRLLAKDAQSVQMFRDKYDELKRIQEEIALDTKDLQGFEEELDLLKRSYNPVLVTGGKFLAGSSHLLSGVVKFGKDITVDIPLEMMDYLINQGVDISDDNVMKKYANAFIDIQKMRSAKAEDALDRFNQFIDTEVNENLERDRTVSQLNTVGDFLSWTADVFARQTPQLIGIYATGGSSAGLMGLSASAYGGKMQEMEKEMERNPLFPKYDRVKMRLVAGGVGIAEYLSERVTAGIMKRSIPSMRGFKAVTKEFKPVDISREFKSKFKDKFVKALKGVKTAGLNANEEGASEVFAQVSENLLDRYVLDKDVNTLDHVPDAYLMGAVMGVGMTAAPALAGMVIKPFTQDGDKRIQKNLKEINELSTKILELEQKGGNKSLINVLQNTMAQREAENADIIYKGLANINALTPKEIRTVSDSQSELVRLKEQYKEVSQSTELNEEQKKMAIDGINESYNTIVKRNHEILQQANTGEARYIINNDIVTKEAFQEFIADETNLEKVVKGETSVKVTNDQIVEKEFINKIKPIQDAIQESSTESVDVREQARDGEEVGVRDTKEQEVTEEEVTDEESQKVADTYLQAEGKLQEVSQRAAKKEKINEKEVDSALDEAYTTLESVEKDTKLSKGDKAILTELIEEEIQKLESYELITETKTGKVTQRRPVKNIRAVTSKVSPEKLFANAEGVIEGNEKVTFTIKGGRVTAQRADGSEFILDTPSMDIIEGGIVFDNNGVLESVTVVDRSGTTVSFSGDVAMDLAIRKRRNEIGEVPEAALQEIIQEEVEVREEVLKTPPTQEAVVSEEIQKKEVSLQDEQGRKRKISEEVKVNSEGVQYIGQDVIGSRGRPQSEKDDAREEVKTKITNPQTNATRKAAIEYNKSADLPLPAKHKKVKSVPEIATSIAEKVESLEDVNRSDYQETAEEREIFESYQKAHPEVIKKYNINNYKQLVQKSYAALVKEIEAQFQSLPVKVEFHDGDKDYQDSAELREDVHNYNHLWIYRGGADHTELGSKTRDKDGVTVNDKFRAVHDYYGHSKEPFEFGRHGEENAWVEHSKMFSKLAQIALTSETRGQNSWVNYSGANKQVFEKLKLASALRKEGIAKGDKKMIARGKDLLKEAQGEFVYAVQKAIVLPAKFSERVTEEVIEEVTPKKKKKKPISSFLKDRSAINKIREQAEKARKAIAKILPDVEIVIHDTQDGFAKEVGEQERDTRGLYDPKTNKIHINLTKANKRTVAHEVFHAVLLNKISSDIELQKVTKRMIEAVNKSLKGNPELQQYLEDFASNYDENIQNEEKLAELTGMLAENYDSMSKPAQSVITRWLQKVATMMGLKPIPGSQTVELLTTIAGKVAFGEEITQQDVQAIEEGGSVNIGTPVELNTKKIKKRKQIDFKDNYPLSYVTQKDAIDINTLLAEIQNKKQKVWFWMADQLGRGEYFDLKIGENHYLDAGPSYALDPANRKDNIIWATGKGPKWVNQYIGSDYLFILSSSPQTSKLFNKRVLDVYAKRLGNYKSFKKEALAGNPVKDIREVLEAHNSWETLRNDPNRKRFLNSVLKQQETPNTSFHKLMQKKDALLDINELRDGFYRENDFGLNDVMLVLKPTKMGGKSKHSTYQYDILGEVVGVPNAKVNAWDIMTDEFKSKYDQLLNPAQIAQAIAPYGAGIRDVTPTRAVRRQKPTPAQQLGTRYNMSETGFTPPTINASAFRQEARAIGLGIGRAKTGSRGYFFTKNGRFFNPFRAIRRQQVNKTQLLKDIENRLNPKSKKYIQQGSDKVAKSKIIADVKKEVAKIRRDVAKKLPKMSEEELLDLLEELKTLEEIGREERKAIEEKLQKQRDEKAAEATILIDETFDGVLQEESLDSVLQDFTKKADDQRYKKGTVFVVDGKGYTKAQFKKTFNKDSDVDSVGIIPVLSVNYTKAQAKKRFFSFMTSSVKDFETLLYSLYGKGKKGKAWFEENVLDPLEDAYSNFHSHSQRFLGDFNTLKKTLIPKVNLAKDTGIKSTEGVEMSIDNVVYIYNFIKDPRMYAKLKAGGIDMRVMKDIVKYMNENPKIKKYADGIVDIYGHYRSSIEEVMDREGYDTFGEPTYSDKQSHIDHLMEEGMSEVEAVKIADELYNMYEDIYGKDNIPQFIPYTPSRVDPNTQEISIDQLFNPDSDVNAVTVLSGNLVAKTHGGTLIWQDVGSLEIANQYANGVIRAVSFLDFFKTTNAIFNSANMNKIEGKKGKEFADNLKYSLTRILTGRKQIGKKDPNTAQTAFSSWINASQGLIMFINTKSALLQQLSFMNYMLDSKPMEWMKAYVSGQFTEAAQELWNTPFMVDRRGGAAGDILMDEVFKRKGNKINNFIKAMYKLGYGPTRISDSVAIILGGTPYYIAKVKEYQSEGLSEAEAKKKALNDFQKQTLKTQQAAREDRISTQQASLAGRMILAFANTPMQYNREIYKAASDIKNKRGDTMRSVGKIGYYLLFQNFLFSSLQQALFSIFGMDDEDEEKKKYLSTANSMLNTILRGLGITGAAMAMVKDVALRAYQQHEEDKIDATDLALAATSISPPIGYKLRIIEQMVRKIQYAEKNQTDDLLTDPYFRAATTGAALVNIPAERLIIKTEAIQDALNTEYENWERLARLMGWSRYALDMPQPWEEEEGSTYTSGRTRKTRATTTRTRTTRKRKTRARR